MRRLRGRRLKALGLALLVLLVAGVVLVLSFGKAWISQIALGKIDGGLAARGLVLQRSSTSWDPVRGLRMSGVKFGRKDQAPMVEADAVELHFPLLTQLFGGGGEGAQLKTRHSALLLRDERGEIYLQDVSIEIESRRDRWRIVHADMRQAGLLAEVSGEVMIREDESGKEAAGWEADFDAVRGTLAALKMESEGKPFRVSGSFQVDARQETVTWNADLNGESAEVSWHGVPLKQASARASLSHAVSTIRADLVLPRGKGNFTVERDGWGEPPFRFSGAVSDAEERSDSFKGHYQTGERVWVLERVEGKADLWSLAQDVPGLASHMPSEETLTIEVFPKHVVTEARGRRGEAWAIGSLEFEGGKVSVKTPESGEVSVAEVQGQASSDGKAWRIREGSARLLGGQVSVRGKLQDQRLSEAVVSAEDLKLAAVKEAAGKDGDGSKGILSFRYHGLLDFGKRSAQGKGTMRLENAPVFSVPLLDETFQLFLSMIPGVERPRTGRFDAVFVAEPGVVEVPRFEASGGTLNVSAKGRVDLKKQRVDGVARGKLTGLPGLVTKPLGRLLEMEVGGPYEDIRVKPLGPAKLVSNTVSGTVGTPVETLEEAGKVVGGVVVEGIKLPFRLFGRGKDKVPSDQ